MKKRFLISLIVVLLLMGLTACEKEIVDDIVETTKQISVVNKIVIETTKEPMVIDTVEDEYEYPIPLGSYQDMLSQRATLEVTFDKGLYYFTISWSSSAKEVSLWKFSGAFDEVDNNVLYDDSRAVTRVYDENGNFEETVRYTNGSGGMAYIDSKLYWLDAREEKLYNDNFNAIFEKIPE